jgi:hypothetical protein
MAADGDIYCCRFWSKLGDQAACNVRYYLLVSHAGNGASQDAVAAAIDAEVATDLKPLMSSAAEYLGSTTQRVWPTPPTVASFLQTARGFGAVTGDPLPKQVSGLIMLRTEFAGRKYRGRMYVPFPGEADNDATTKPSAGYQARLVTLGNSLVADVNAGAAPDTSVLQPGLPGRTKTPVPGDPDRFTYPLNGTFVPFIDNFGLRTIWATQRRRGDFGRKNVSPFG